MIVLADGEASTFIRCQSDGVQVERGAGPGATDGIKDGGGADFLAAFQADDDLLSGCAVDGDNLFVAPEHDPDAAHVILERLDGFLVDKLQQARAAFDQRHVNAHGGENRRVFRADDATADDRDGLGQIVPAARGRRCR